MSTEHALRAHLRAHPDDWEGWLVYADWLADQGDVRARLIQLEHRIALGWLFPVERSEVKQELEALVQQHKKEWLAGWARPRGTDLEWCHGFVRGVRFSKGGDWLPAFEALAVHPVAWTLTSLVISDNDVDAKGAAALAASPVCCRLLSIDLRHNRIGDGGARALAGSTRLGGLTWLDLRHNGIGKAGAEALASSATLRSLATLQLDAPS